MRIAIFVDCYYPRVNGVVVSVKTYSEELIRKGHKVFIVCPDYSEDVKLLKYVIHGSYYDSQTKQDERISVLRIPSHRIVWSKEDRLGLMIEWHKIKKELDSFKPDIVHLNSEFSMGFLGLIYARHRRLPTAFTFHTLWEEYFASYSNALPQEYLKDLGKKFVRFYLKRVNEIIVPTERIGKVVDRYEIKNKYDILPTGIPSNIKEYDEDKYKEFTDGLHKEYPVLKDKKILLYVGRIAKEKNLNFLVDMYTELRKTQNDVAMLIVGGGPELNQLQKYASKSDYKDEICFTGMQPREKLPYIYHFGDIFVFPSCTETQGLVTIEAMMTGLPVVAIGEMGTKDVMNGDNGGFMVNNDVKEFSSKVELLLKDEDLYNKKSAEAKEWSKQWDLSLLTDKLVEFYNKGIEDYEKKNR